MTKSNYSLGWFLQGVFRGSLAIWLWKWAINGISAFPPAPSVSRQFCVISCCLFLAMMLQNDPQISSEWSKGWCNVWDGKGVHHLWSSHSPDLALLSWKASASAESNWRISDIGHLTHKSGLTLSGQLARFEILECSKYSESLDSASLP